MPERHSWASAAVWRAARQRGRRGGERALGVLGRGEVVAVVGDDELEAQLIGRGGGQGGAPPPASAPSSPSPAHAARDSSMVSS